MKHAAPSPRVAQEGAASPPSWSWLFGRAESASPAFRYGVATILFLVALVVRHALDGDLPPGFPFLTFFPAVILTAFAVGTGPAVLCATLSGLAAWYYFLAPGGSFALTGALALALGFYVFIVGVDIALVHVARRGAERLAEARETTARLHAEQRLMFEELQHRVANNMAFVASLLRLERSRVEADPSLAPSVLAHAQERLETLGRVHRRLHDPDAVRRPVGDHLRSVCEDVAAASGAPGIAVRVEADPSVRLDLTRLTALSLLATELMTNSLKHAFRGRDGGRITVALRRLGEGRLELSVADDGVGMGEGGLPGLGTRIAAGLAGQLGGELIAGRNAADAPGGVGTTARVAFAE